MKLILIFILFFVLKGYSQQFQGFAALSYGGPLPVKKIQNSGGNPIPGAYFGLNYLRLLSEKYQLSAGISYRFTGVNYFQDYHKDTMVTVTIGEQTGEVPTYYTAHINGQMRLSELSFPITFQRISNKSTYTLGLTTNYLIIPDDKGHVRVIIGEGGFFDDVHQDFNNRKNINPFYFSLNLEMQRKIIRNVCLFFSADRSFMPFYKKGQAPSRTGEPVNLFMTRAALGISYRFFASEK